MKTTHAVTLGGALLAIAALTMSCSQDDSMADNTTLAATASATDTETQDTSTTADNSDGWNEVFYDDFEGTDSVPDPTKWRILEPGKAEWAKYHSGTVENSYQKDGILYLVAKKDGDTYKTGAIDTQGKFDFTYGKVEVRAKMPAFVDGEHTGIWMMPTPPAEAWPKSGEIDIMEHIKQQDYVWETIHTYWADDMGHSGDPKVGATASINPHDWNTYSVTWTPESITYSINGVENFTYPNNHLSGEDGFYQWPFDKNFYLILSISVGGADTWAGPIDNAGLPAVFQVDWVKIYQQATGSAGVPKITAD